MTKLILVKCRCFFIVFCCFFFGCYFNDSTGDVVLARFFQGYPTSKRELWVITVVAI